MKSTTDALKNGKQILLNLEGSKQSLNLQEHPRDGPVVSDTNTSLTQE